MRPCLIKQLGVASALALALLTTGCANSKTEFDLMSGGGPSVGSSVSSTKSSSIVALAKQYDGLNERNNRSALKRITGVDPVETPWCAAFLNKLLEKKGMKGTDSLQAVSFLKWGKRTSTPEKGDIVVMRNHVGIFISFTPDGKSVNVLGGNQNDAVNVATYPRRRVLAYRTAG